MNSGNRGFRESFCGTEVIMKWIIAVMIVIFVLPGYGLAQKIDYAETKSREWTDSSGQNGVAAKLVSFDKTTRQVVLQCDDATTIEVPVTDLSISDRRYISRQTSKFERESKHAGHKNRTATGRSEAQAEGVQRLYGIDWHQQLESARRVAVGNEGVADNKPIIWFRVLGDLSGYM